MNIKRAKNLVAAGYAEKLEIELAYAIGVAHPMAIMVDSFGTGRIPDEETAGAAVHNAPARRARMSFGTSLALSFNNLLTKKGRTILTGLAGSIGIIGIALILSLSTGANRYIEQIQFIRNLRVAELGSVQGAGRDQ